MTNKPTAQMRGKHAATEAPKRVALAPWEKVSAAFVRLPVTEQHSFFALHEDAILQWVTSRKA